MRRACSVAASNRRAIGRFRYEILSRAMLALGSSPLSPSPRLHTILRLSVIAVDSLPARFHGDPADRLIVAMARTHGIPLATRDRAIRRSRTAKLWSP